MPFFVTSFSLEEAVARVEKCTCIMPFFVTSFSLEEAVARVEKCT